MRLLKARILNEYNLEIYIMIVLSIVLDVLMYSTVQTPHYTVNYAEEKSVWIPYCSLYRDKGTPCGNSLQLVLVLRLVYAVSCIISDDSRGSRFHRLSSWWLSAMA